jgi:hypothetical protein
VLIRWTRLALACLALFGAAAPVPAEPVFDAVGCLASPPPAEEARAELTRPVLRAHARAPEARARVWRPAPRVRRRYLEHRALLH